mgnify:CR=1 FL=1
MDIFSLKALYRFLLVTTLVAVAAVLSYFYLPERQLSLLPSKVDEYHLFFDAQDGGATNAQWLDENTFQFSCINNGAATNLPYCGISVKIKPPSSQSDFTGFDHIQLSLNYQGANERLRIKMHSYLPPTIASSRREVLKGLDVSFAVQDVNQPIVLNNQIWHQGDEGSFGTKGENLEMDIVLDLVPPFAVGEHILQLQQIVLDGPWISASKWYLAVALCWLLSNLLFFVAFLRKQEKRIRNDSNRLSRLTNYSTNLQQESQHYKLLSSHDPLTNTLNRNGFAEEVMQLFPQGRLKLNTSLIVIDLDNFKAINDKYGHDTGDIVLRESAANMVKNIRVGDRLVRWGGEEFILFCVDTSAQQAQLIAEKIRTSIEKMSINYQQHSIAVTVSLGVGVSSHLEEFDQLFQRTDKALYQAKNMGRNCVVFAE